MTPTIDEITALINLMKAQRILKLQTSQITLELDGSAFHTTMVADTPKPRPPEPGEFPSDDDMLFYSTKFFKGTTPDAVEEPADG
jgi:hypothetical protein